MFKGIVLRRRQRVYMIPAVVLLLMLYSLNLYSKSASLPEENRGPWRFCVVTDMDEKSILNKGTDDERWTSMFQCGVLSSNDERQYSVMWDSKSVNLYSRISEGGRGMELSDLCWYNNKLYTFDDRTGIVYEILHNKAYVRYILRDGDGNTEKGFKSEWCTVKDNLLYVGAFGKEWTNDKGEIINNNPKWIKTIDNTGHMTHINMTDMYDRIRKAAGYQYPGYMWHEAAAWNPITKQWYFAPRRAAKTMYSPAEDELKGSNVWIATDEKFQNIHVSNIGVVEPLRGVSTFKFVPGRPHDVLALKSTEHDGKTTTYITAFDISGNILMEDTLMSNDYKFEGLEFVPYEYAPI